jgi:hypothetical protein
MITPHLQTDPTSRVTGPLNRAAVRPASLRKKLLLVVPLPISCYFLVRALSLTSTSAGSDPAADLANGLVRSLLFLGAFGFLFISVRAFLAIKRPRE